MNNINTNLPSNIFPPFGKMFTVHEKTFEGEKFCGFVDWKHFYENIHGGMDFRIKFPNVIFHSQLTLHCY